MEGDDLVIYSHSIVSSELSCSMGIAISASCFVVQSLLTDFSIVLNSLQRRQKGLKAWNKSKKQILVL